jgi:hypothetical protein
MTNISTYQLYASDKHQTQNLRVIQTVFLLLQAALPANSPSRLAKVKMDDSRVKLAYRHAQSTYDEFHRSMLASAPLRDERPAPVPSAETYTLAREFLEKAVDVKQGILLFY